MRQRCLAFPLRLQRVPLRRCRRAIFFSGIRKVICEIGDEQFLLPGWRAFLQNGSLGIAPRPVVDAVTDYLTLGGARSGRVSALGL